MIQKSELMVSYENIKQNERINKSLEKITFVYRKNGSQNISLIYKKE